RGGCVRARKLCMVPRSCGRDEIAHRMRAPIRVGQERASWIYAEEGWERMAPTPFSTVCFRCRPAELPEEEVDLLNQSILAEVNASGEVFLSHTRLRGRYALRVAIGNIRTTEDHVRRAWELLREAAQQAPAL